MMHDGKVLFAENGKQCFFKFIGEIRHSVSPGFAAVLDRLIAENRVDSYVLDLREVDYMDSTNLGLLAKIAQHSIRQTGEKPVAISANEEILDILKSMGFDRVLTLVREYDHDRVELQYTPDINLSKRDKARLIVGAHRSLMEMDEKSRKVFKDVVEMFEKDLATHP